MSADLIYLDHAATTPLEARVIARMLACLDASGTFANPSSEHAAGRAAAAVVEGARRELATALGAEPDELVFTSGATEADNLALRGVLGAAPRTRRRLVTLKTEHKAVLDTAKALARAGQPVTLLEPGPDGRLAPATLAAALGADVALVSIMLVHNETGVVQDLAALAEVAHAHGALLHADCAQAVGKVAVDVGALGLDLASFSAHKSGGPKGVGALWLRRGVALEAQQTGGGQERGWRAGTLATHQIVGMAAAFGHAVADLAAERARLTELRAQLRTGLLALGAVYDNGAPADCVPHILSLSFGGVHGESLRAALPGLAVSGGAACDAQTGEPSAVLRVLGRDAALAAATLRFSLGRGTTASDIEAAHAQVAAALDRLRAMAPGPAGGG